MPRKLTISLYETVYEGLHRSLSPGRICRLLEALVPRPAIARDLHRSYSQMASEEAREREGAQWADALAPDVAD